MNIAIYIDYDNVNITLDQYYQTSSNKNCLATDIIKKIKACFNNDKILTFKAFADFQKVNAVLTTLQKNQVELRHVYSANTRKNASDIAMVISVMKSIYSNDKIDKYIIVSSDSDMLPVINEIQYFNKDVFVIYSEYGSKEGYGEYLKQDEYKTIEDLCDIKLYVPIIDNELKNDSTLLPRIENILNVINDGIINTFNQYINNGGGTASKKDVKEYIYGNEMLNIVNNDASLIVDYLLKNKALLESKISNSSYNKVLISPTYIENKNINLKNPMVSESNYQKGIDGKLHKIELTKSK